MRTALCAILPALLLQVACTPTARPPQAAEQPPLMAGEARFVPMPSAQQAELQQVLAPFLQKGVQTELWYHAARTKDNGSFAWCISPAPAKAEWVYLGTVPQTELRQLAAEQTSVQCGNTLDYWLRFELRSGSHRLPVSICPAEEFGISGCTASNIRARAFHRTLWQLTDRKFGIQKRFDKIVLE